MAYPNIVFNNSTGSDTQASGAGPTTAVFGTGASLSASTSVNLSADSPDLSGVATDGSAVLWVLTSSGREFSKITGVDNGTKIVTVETTYSVTESGRTWAIGGKRSTLHNADSLKLFTTDARPTWRVEIQYTGVDYNFTNSGTGTHTFVGGASTAQRGLTIYGSGATRPTIICRPGTPQKHIFLANGSVVKSLRFYLIKPYDVYTTVFQPDGYCTFEDCIFTSNDSNQGVAYINSGYFLVVLNCYFENLTSAAGGVGIEMENVNPRCITVKGCYFYNMRRGISVISDFGYDCCIEKNVFHNCTDASIVVSSASASHGAKAQIINNTFYGCRCYIDTSYSKQAVIVGNFFVNSATYGIDTPSGANDIWILEDYNHFYNNTSGNINNSIPIGTNSTTGTNPNFTDVSGKDFSFTNTFFKGKGGFASIPLLPHVSYLDPGAIQSAEAGGGVFSASTRGGFVN